MAAGKGIPDQTAGKAAGRLSARTVSKRKAAHSEKNLILTNQDAKTGRSEKTETNLFRIGREENLLAESLSEANQGADRSEENPAANSAENLSARKVSEKRGTAENGPEISAKKFQVSN